MTRHLSNVIAFDDGPFKPQTRGDILLIATVYTDGRMEGVLTGKIRRDGVNSTNTIIKTIRRSRFRHQLQLVMLQGIAFAGFNVVDIHRVAQDLKLPVMVVCRKQPNFKTIKQALLKNVPGGKSKWRLIERVGPMKKVGDVYTQCIGISEQQARKTLQFYTPHGKLPEPLRTAHMIAGAMVDGESRHRA